MPYSIRSIYRYVEQGYLSLKNIDLRRVVRYKPRRKKAQPRPSPRKKIGHTYEYFLKYTEDYHEARVVEMDLVEGRKGGKLLRMPDFWSSSQKNSLGGAVISLHGRQKRRP